MKHSFLAVLTLYSISSMVCPAAQADETALFACIKKYTSLRISPDAALAQCKEKSLASCVKKLLGKENLIVSTTKVPASRKTPAGYLIDLGNDQEMWMEGGKWREMGCYPVVGGPSKTSRIGDPWNGEVKLEWFRQGSCPSSEFNTGKTYNLADAETVCKLEAIKNTDE